MNIKNHRWYADKGELGAIYFETHTDVSGAITADEWTKTRFGMVCTDPASFAEDKAALEKLCEQTKDCVLLKDPVTQNFFNRMEALAYERRRTVQP